VSTDFKLQIFVFIEWIEGCQPLYIVLWWSQKFFSCW